MANGNVFVYGTLLADEIVRILIKRVPSSCDAVLADYHRFSVRNRVYPGATYRKGDRIKGKKVLLDLTHEELQVMDDFEGEEYKRLTVEPCLLDQSITLTAFVYVWGDPEDKDLFGSWDYEVKLFRIFVSFFLRSSFQEWRSNDLERYEAMCEEYMDTGINVT
ncbi:hypothetical protein SELMODRAFT_107410 [Selaginella moellendorffii]|uniref:Putative gamma-glutamylcyclotransferase n=1 Tax=Selaginella moellendorffii TaxID=88036 RepID=D8S394_SELML|nr:hypothetical protein SELMODRAFT_107410 [Selaginella moellendorffii]